MNIMHNDTLIYTELYTYIYIYIYTHTYVERDRDRERGEGSERKLKKNNSFFATLSFMYFTIFRKIVIEYCEIHDT